MNAVNRENADKILRHIFELKKENQYATLDEICNNEEIEQMEGAWLFEYLESKGLVEVWAKGDGRNKNDFYVSLTKEGMVFFSEDNLVSQYTREQTVTPLNIINQNNYISGNAKNFGNNRVENSVNVEPTKENWVDKLFKDTTSQIISGLIVAAIIGLITWYFSRP